MQPVVAEHVVCTQHTCPGIPNNREDKEVLPPLTVDCCTWIWDLKKLFGVTMSVDWMICLLAFSFVTMAEFSHKSKHD